VLNTVGRFMKRLALCVWPNLPTPSLHSNVCVDLIGMEACTGSHFRGRALIEQGRGASASTLLRILAICSFRLFKVLRVRTISRLAKTREVDRLIVTGRRSQREQARFVRCSLLPV
jgi:hypothetical protein